GGSLRVLARAGGVASPSVTRVLDAERAAGLDGPEAFCRFAAAAVEAREAIERFFDARPSVLGYGAPSKAVTLLTWCGIGPDSLPFTVDRSPHKQGRTIPGARVPIEAPARLIEARPERVFLLTWDLRDEVMAQLPEVREWGGRFV